MPQIKIWKFYLFQSFKPEQMPIFTETTQQHCYEIKFIKKGGFRSSDSNQRVTFTGFKIRPKGRYAHIKVRPIILVISANVNFF